MSQMPELHQNSVPQLPLLAPLPRVAQPVIQGFQAINAVEVIDLTGLSIDGDEGGDEDGDEDNWEDIPIIDLTNLPSDDDDGADAEGQHGPVQSYTILNLPPRNRYTLIDRPPITAPTRPSRRTRRAVRTTPHVSARAPARVPVRRDVCELCARVVRWGPGCLITKHHLYPQEITKKYADRYTLAQKNSIALICRPCHDACHRTHDNRTLADFYYEVDLLKADPTIQAHIRLMQRATTPELIRRHGDGVNVRGRKYHMRAARAAARAEEARNAAASRPQLTEANLRALDGAAPPRVVRRSARLAGTILRIREPTPPPGARRSARLLEKSVGGQHEVPVIVIDDEDEDMQDLAVHEDPKEKQDEELQDVAMHESPAGKENEKVQNAVGLGALLDLAASGEYIAL